jgi:tryptophan synthase alpha chain
VNRIDGKFNYLKKAGQKALITFITVGDPDPETTGELVVAMERAGADIVELGIPYSDPLADGPVIQRASDRALKAGTKIATCMQTAKSIREKCGIPLVFLVYYNSVFNYGPEKFAIDARNAGIDGIIIPDLPVEERNETAAIASSCGIHLIPLVAPTSHERIKNIVEGAGGFVYCISSKGVTGVREDIETDIKAYMEEVSRYTALPRALGFGISGPDMAKRFRDCCEGLIVGSAIVRLIEQGKDRRRMLSNVCEFVSRIKEVL